MEVVLLGAGGHAKVVASVARRAGFVVAGFLDDMRPLGASFQGGQVLGPLKDIDKQPEHRWFFVALGDNATRQRLFEALEAGGRRLATLVDPHADVAEDVQLGAGTVVMPGAVVLPGAVVGKNCILNTSCCVGEACCISDHVHLCPGTCLEAEVSVAEGAMLGTGVIVLQGCRVGSRSVVGAGSLVDCDLGSDVLAYGRPLQVRPRQTL
jgi:acetyltransferase EpsM